MVLSASCQSTGKLTLTGKGRLSSGARCNSSSNVKIRLRGRPPSLIFWKRKVQFSWQALPQASQKAAPSLTRIPCLLSCEWENVSHHLQLCSLLFMGSKYLLNNLSSYSTFRMGSLWYISDANCHFTAIPMFAWTGLSATIILIISLHFSEKF